MRIALLPFKYPNVIATLYLGGIVTAISPLYTPKEIQFQLEDSGSKIIVTLDLFLNNIREVRDKTKLEHVIVSSVADELSPIKGFLYRKIINRKSPKPNENELIYSNLLKNAEEKDLKAKIDPENDLAKYNMRVASRDALSYELISVVIIGSIGLGLAYFKWRRRE